METTNENGQPSPANRGEKVENIKDDFSKTLEHPSQTVEPERTYSADNSGLDALIDEATATKADVTPSKPEAVQQMISAEEAAGLAVGALQEFCTGIAKMTGKKIEFGGKFVTVFAMAATPVIQKYSRHINLDPEKVDLDSWAPECLAVGALAAVGGSTWWQLRNAEPISAEVETGGDNGDKPK